MKRSQVSFRGVSLLVVLAMLLGLVSPALAADPQQPPSDSSSIVGTAYSENSNAYEIYPVPHSVTYSDGQFTMTNDVNVVAGDGVDEYTTDFLEEILERFGHTMTTSAAVDGSKTNVVLAIHGDSDPVSPSTVANLFTAQDKYDPYILTADASENTNGVITIVGKDTDCVYYGVATLQMMFTSFNGEKFLPVRIEDYSNTIFRGFIEGFYGGFDYVGRESQVRAIRDVKGNMYVFASKTDAYHGGTHWADSYPDPERNQIKALVDVCKAMKVNYTWSLHIGKAGVLGANNNTPTEAEYAQRLQQVKNKFQSLYDIGVRSFQILNDDANSGSNAACVRLLNDVNAWLKTKDDCMPLIYCCKGYNTAWAGNGAELQELQDLNDDIYLYWTGSDVNSPITQTSVNWPVEKSGHQVVTWLNYPCSEHAKSGLFLGDISHYVSSADDLTDQYGILSNAINSPEANKVAYFQLLSWAWNRDSYTTYLTELWEDSFKYLQPEVYGSYLTIARNVSNCPGSGRVPAGFPESEYIKDALAAVQEALLNGEPLADIQGAQDLLDELGHILSAIADFRANCENSALKTELEPWLKSLTGVVTAGKNAILAADALAQNDVNTAWETFSAASLGMAQWDTNQSSNPNYDADVMAKAGSRRLQPFASALIEYVEEKLLPLLSPDGGLGSEPTFYAVIGGDRQTASAQSDKLFDANPTTYGHFATNQKVDDYYGVDLGQVKLVTAVDILQGQTNAHHDYFHNAALECSADGENWVTLVSRVNSHHIQVEDLSVAARYVRLRLTETGYGNKADYWTDVREFTVTTAGVDTDSLLYTSLDDASALSAGEDGGVYTLTAGGQITLPAGGYAGLCLPEISSVAAITLSGALPAGLTLQYSPNGVLWTDGVPSQTVAARFVRLVNHSGNPVTAALPTLSVTLNASTELSFVSTNTNIYQGNVWANSVDGDRTTFAWTDSGQKVGDYAIYDLGAAQPVHDVSLWLPETGNDIPHSMEISVGSSSDPNGTWTVIGSIQDNAGINMSPPNRVFTCDGQGVMGRYLKLSITAASNNWLKISEVEVNKTAEQAEYVGALSGAAGDYQNAVDGNLSTFYVPSGGAGHLQYLLPELTSPTAVTVLQSPATISGAALLAQKADGEWEKFGELDQGACTFENLPDGGIVALKVEWEDGKAPAIAEIILVGAGSGVVGGTIPVLRNNIYEQPAAVADVTVPNGTAIENVSLPDRVNVTDNAGNTVSAPVEWTCGDYNSTTAETYTFTGQFTESNTLFNPGCFTLTANVTVNPAASTPGDPEEENLALNRPAYASGQEETGNSPDKAVDGDSSEDSRWNSNYMKVRAENPAWLVVDLGENVADITSISMRYHNLVWPTDYKVQVAGANFTPVDYSEINGAGSTVDANTFAGNNAGDAACWSTIQTYSDVSYNAHPTVTINKADFEAEIPAGTRYLRLYFTGMNSAAIGHCVSLWELTVTGTRQASAINTNIASLASASATGTVGTDFAALDLPDTVIATLVDGSTVRVDVDWDGTGYDSTSTDAQTFTGTITLPSGVTNNGNVTVSLTLTLAAAPTIVSGSVRFTPASLSVANGTAFADLGLPTQGTATLTDGSAVAGTITWTESDYSATRAGEQTISGTFTSGGKTVGVSIEVTVAAPPVIRHTVTFRSEGSADTIVRVIHGQAIGTLTIPTRDGYTFEGWFYGDPETRLTEEYVVNGDLTVTAKWTLKQYTVTFNTQGGSDVDAQTVNHGGTVREPDDPTRTGHTFVGWYTDGDPARLYDFTTPVTANLILYAGWDESVDPTPPVVSNPPISGGGMIIPPSTTTTTTTNPDGSTTTTVTDNRTGTVTETTEKPDGSTETVETKKDGTVTATTEKPDGITEVVETKPDGTVTATTTDSEGGKVEKITTPDEDVTITVTDPEGETLAKVELPAEIPASPIEFVDVPKGHWAESAINQAAGLGLVQGVGDNRFDMGSEMKRGDLAVVLYNLSNGSGGYEVTFDDVPAAEYYADGVAWAVTAGVVNGYSDTEFGPEDTITREQLAVMLYRYAELLKLDTVVSGDELEAFNDGGNASRWAVDGMAWCVKNDILQGWGGGILAPGVNATRAEVVVMLRRFMELLG